MYTLYLKRHLKSIIIWCIVLVLFLVASMTKYTAFQENPEQAAELLDLLPNAVKVIYGMGNGDITQLGVYYSVVAFYFQLMLALYAGILGSKIIYEEEDLKTSEFLFVKPISRTKVLLTKYLGALSVITILNLFITMFSYVYFKTSYEMFDNFFALSFSQYMICIFTLSLGTLFTSIKYSRFSSMLIAGITMLFFILRSVALLVEINLWFLTPFYAFECGVAYEEGFNILYALYYLVLSAICIVVAVKQLNNRDIKS